MNKESDQESDQETPVKMRGMYWDKHKIMKEL
jgi:hypothetical protein